MKRNYTREFDSKYLNYQKVFTPHEYQPLPGVIPKVSTPSGILPKVSTPHET